MDSKLLPTFVALLLVTVSFEPAATAHIPTGPTLSATSVTAAFFEISADQPGNGTPEPRLVIFDDGRFLLQRDTPVGALDTPPGFLLGELTLDEQLALTSRETEALRDSVDRGEFEEPDCDCPTSVFVFRHDDEIAVLTNTDFPLGIPTLEIGHVLAATTPRTLIVYREYLLDLIQTERDLVPCPATLLSSLVDQPLRDGLSQIRRAEWVPFCGIYRHACMPLRLHQKMPRLDPIAVDLPLLPPPRFAPSLRPPPLIRF